MDEPGCAFMEGGGLEEEALGLFVELIDVVGGGTDVLLGEIGLGLIHEIKIIFNFEKINEINSELSVMR